MTFGLQHKSLVAAFFALLFVVLIVPINRAAYFDEAFGSRSEQVFAAVMVVVFGFALYTLSYYALVFVQRLRNQDQMAWRWMKVSAGYFALNTTVLLLIWPGFWVWDEFVGLNVVQTNEIWAWQHIFTGIYYQLSLLLIPSGVGIVLIQSLFSSIVVGYIVAGTARGLKRPGFALLLLIPFLFFPVVLNNFYPLRLTVYSYLEILVFFRIIFIVLDRSLVANAYREAIALSCAVVILAFWRSEGIYLLALLPVVIIFLVRCFGPLRSMQITATLGVVLSMLVGTFALTNAFSNPRYQLTATLNPLSMVLQTPDIFNNMAPQIKTIDRVVDVEMVRAMPSPYEVPSFWAGAVREDFESYVSDYNNAVGQIFVAYPRAFVSARWQTFLGANALGDVVPQVQGAGTYLGNLEPFVADEIQLFEDRNAFSTPINKDLRNAVVTSLLMIDNDSGRTSGLGKIVWSVIPVLFLLGVVLALMLARRAWLYAGLIGLVASRAGLVFLTAPASYFMYFLPVYMTGWALLFYFFAQGLDRRFTGSSKPKLLP